jgi:hypothetical protein
MRLPPNYPRRSTINTHLWWRYGPAGVAVIALLSVAANIVGLIEFGSANPWLYVVLVVLVAAVVVWTIASRSQTYLSIRRALSEAEKEMRRSKLNPSRLIAFDRSSAVFAGMLCQRMHIAEVLVLPRRAVQPVAGKAREIKVGDDVVFTPSQSAGDDLIFVYHLRTGSTLEAGLRALGSHGANLPILALYATAGAKAQWPGVIAVQMIRAGFVPNERFPWMSSDYKHE